MASLTDGTSREGLDLFQLNSAPLPSSGHIMSLQTSNLDPLQEHLH